VPVSARAIKTSHPRSELQKPPRAVWDHLALVMQVGLTFAGSVLFCLAIGYWLDRWLGTKGIFTAVFILLGIAGGGYTVYRQIMELDDNQPRGRRSKGGPGD
jgi:ATP synthase protein I